MIALDPRTLAGILGGDVVNDNSINAPGPGHSKSDRSLSIRIIDAHRGQIIVHSHAGDDWKMCKDYVRGQLGLGQWEFCLDNDVASSSCLSINSIAFFKRSSAACLCFRSASMATTGTIWPSSLSVFKIGGCKSGSIALLTSNQSAILSYANRLYKSRRKGYCVHQVPRGSGQSNPDPAWSLNSSASRT